MIRPAFFAAFTLIALVARGEDPSASGSSPASFDVAQLIRQLEDDNPAVRDAAEESLTGLGPPVELALREAMPSAPPESRARIGRILRWVCEDWSSAAEELVRASWQIGEDVSGDERVMPVELDGPALQPIRDVCCFFRLIIPDETVVGRHVVLAAVWRDRTSTGWDEAGRLRLIQAARLKADGPGRRAIAALSIALFTGNRFSIFAWKFEDRRLEESGQELVYRHHRLDVQGRNWMEDQIFEFKPDSLEIANERHTGAAQLSDDDVARLQAAVDPFLQDAAVVVPESPAEPDTFMGSW